MFCCLQGVGNHKPQSGNGEKEKKESNLEDKKLTTSKTPQSFVIKANQSTIATFNRYDENVNGSHVIRETAFLKRKTGNIQNKMRK